MGFHRLASFHWLDYAIFGATLGVSLAIGLFYAIRGGGQKTTSAFLVGDRQMPVIPTALSLLVSFQSGILVLGVSSEMYVKGTNFAWYLLGIVVGLPLAALVYQPIFYKLQLTSAYEYLELRFRSKLIRYIGSVLCLTSTLLYMGIVLYAPAVALNGVTGLDLNLLIIVSGLACTAYTAMGGLKAVVWTDAFQAVIMYIGFLAIIIQGVLDVGSVQEVWKRAWEGGRIITNWNPDPFTYLNFWSVLFGTALGWMSVYGTNQTAVQRYTSLSSLKRAQLSLVLVIPGMLTLFPLVVISGLVMYAYYHECDPLNSKQIASRDQLLPHFTVEVLSYIPGMPGIFLACLYSGTLSSVSSGVNSLSAVLWEDFLKQHLEKRLTPLQQTRVNKVLSLLIGLASIGLACMAKYLGGVLQASMTVLSMLGGATAGLFLFGMIWPWGNRFGALCGVTAASLIMGWICIGAQIIKPYRNSLPRSIANCSAEVLEAAGFMSNGTLMPEYFAITRNESLSIGKDLHLTGINYVYYLSYKMYGLSGILIVFAVGIPASLIASRVRLDIRDLHFMWPGLRHVCCCLLPRTWIDGFVESEEEIRVIEELKAQGAKTKGLSVKGRSLSPSQQLPTVLGQADIRLVHRAKTRPATDAQHKPAQAFESL